MYSTQHSQLLISRRLGFRICDQMLTAWYAAAFIEMNTMPSLIGSTDTISDVIDYKHFVNRSLTDLEFSCLSGVHLSPDKRIRTATVSMCIA